MSDDIIVTQHFDDPIGSVIEVDGQCYVKIDEKSDTITRYITDGKVRTYHSTCSDCSDQVNGTALCPPEFGDEVYTIGYITGSVILSTSTIKLVPTDINYNTGIYTVSYLRATSNILDTDPENAETDYRPYTSHHGIYSPKANVGFVTTRVTLQDPNYIHPWL